MQNNVYRIFFGFTSFKKEDFEELMKKYPFHLNIFHKFLEEVIVIPFMFSPPHELKTTFPEGSIVKVAFGEKSKEAFYLVVIFGREKE